MQIHQLKRKHSNKKPTRVGRGGKRGKTSGHGTKGQKARAGRKLRPEERDIIKRLPKRRGYGKNRSHTVNSSVVKPTILDISVLDNYFSDNDTITPKILLERKLIKRSSGKIPSVKFLGNTDIKKKLVIENCLISKTAKEKVESAGGSVK